ncbi:MAG: hypothetical protein DRR16_14765 [Candidatus Parabeggiatoa sp. nov. 3]|nr:MAG: hypothetical protein DRR00_12625 [Gammaproteobacteria bacterium]RKZ64333.1 MAG: hypothetical protein DRQ99_15640 [Gammaproteobacteria bacterium]RKZ84423.1 MAG: hypothetical protein DRR16_14765 [Gammaproteobacteria bacterium]
MSIKIKESQSNTTIKEIEEFEFLIGSTLPDEYKKFLLKHNGGRPKLNMSFKFKEPVQNWDQSMLGWFYSLGDDEYCNLEEEFKVWRDYLLNDMLIIANNPGGAFVILGILGDKRGKVYFWSQDFEDVDDEYEICHTFALVADSFNDFLNSLSKMKDEDGQQEREV